MTQQALRTEHTLDEATLYMSFELSDKRWKLTFGDHRCAPSVTGKPTVLLTGYWSVL